MSELLKKQNYGVEVEFTGITRAMAAEAVAEVIGSTVTGPDHTCYHTIPVSCIGFYKFRYFLPGIYCTANRQTGSFATIFEDLCCRFFLITERILAVTEINAVVPCFQCELSGTALRFCHKQTAKNLFAVQIQYACLAASAIHRSSFHCVSFRIKQYNTDTSRCRSFPAGYRNGRNQLAIIIKGSSSAYHKFQLIICHNASYGIVIVVPGKIRFPFRQLEYPCFFAALFSTLLLTL